MTCIIPFEDLYYLGCPILDNAKDYDNMQYEYGISASDWLNEMPGYWRKKLQKDVDDWWEKLNREDKLSYLGKYVFTLEAKKSSINNKLTEIAIYQNQFYDD